MNVSFLRRPRWFSGCFVSLSGWNGRTCCFPAVVDLIHSKPYRNGNGMAAIKPKHFLLSRMRSRQLCLRAFWKLWTKVNVNGRIWGSCWCGKMWWVRVNGGGRLKCLEWFKAWLFTFLSVPSLKFTFPIPHLFFTPAPPSPSSLYRESGWMAHL